MLFKRKQEFKPDKTGTSLLSKLYITPLQRKTLLKWVLFALCLTAVCLVQDVIFSRITIAGAKTDLVAAAILLTCILLPTESCAVFSVIASTVYFFSGMAAGPYTILFLTGLGILINIWRTGYLRKGFSSTLICTAAAIFFYEMLLFIIGVFLGHTTFNRFGIFCISAGISVAAVPVFYPIFLFISKLGGETWRD